MKFDVIIGNPPYQLTTNEENKQARPIYDNFVINAINMHPKYTSFIIPSRWMNGGMGLDKFREMMLGNENIRQLHDYIEASDCFPGIQLTGGVCYFLIDNNYHGLCDIYTHFNGGTSRSRRYLKNQSSDIFIRFNEAVSIIDKIKKKNSTSFSNRVSAIDPFGLSKLDTNSSNFEKKYLTRNKEATNIQIYGNNWNDNNRRYIDRSLVTVNKKQIGKYKVYISKANGAASSKIPYSVLSRPFIGLPDTVCSVTYLVVSCDDKDQAQSICGYMRTKFFRFLVSLMKNTQNTSKTSFSFVPDMDFSKEWKDPDLYSLFNLDNEEIEFIEKMILPMEDK